MRSAMDARILTALLRRGLLAAGLSALAAAPALAQVWLREGERIQVTPAPDPSDPFAPPGLPEEPPPAPELLEAPAPAARMKAGEEAHLRFLDRRTSTRGALVSPVGSTARYGGLIVEVLACHREIGGDESAAFLRIREEATEGAATGAPVFSGWMFALSPSLSALDHPRYDVWVAECRTAEGSESAANR
ncbi:DUF2155 domain-containing protein [Neomegalonema sp.]|uniref:DUF2155 domain-containing protein n=1 Tax=Neomegalonema sp. TaxID=2039713 RepID=UPI002632E6EC|nr:DUF2155 domain-containing protein [Neomegalonema sp.]MDD2868204.1 DUF2155 domain-containing protein [Neomegalonema sp.]